MALELNETTHCLLLDTDPDQTVNMWMDLWKLGQLDGCHLRSYWKKKVPLIYRENDNCACPNLTYDDTLATKVLFNTLDTFICNGPADEVLARLQRAEKPAQFCGRVFKLGEATYSCRDCGMDPTCVLCVDCFRTSVHKNHRYKMNTSSGGGYCDCGDLEAWKQAPACDRHMQKTQEDEQESPLQLLPADLVSRATLVFRTVLDYCFEMLTLEDSAGLPSDLKWSEENLLDTYTTMLFNDEVHTYEQVISTLMRAIQCSKKEAIDYATAVDREGRSIVRCGPFNGCTQVKTVIERSTSRHSGRPLKVCVMHTHVVAHQLFAVRLLIWLQRLIGESRGLRLLLGDILTERIDEDRPCRLERLLECDTHMWKAVRCHWHQLFIGGMLMEPGSKRDFARVYTRKYQSLMQDFVEDDHEHALSVLSLSVQIFTVPTLAHMLIEEEDVLSVLLRTFRVECEKKRNAEGKLAFERNQANMCFLRAQFVFSDMRYVLSSKPDANRWTEAMRKNFLNGLSYLLVLLSWMQGMDASVRQVGQHMEFEPEWESAFTLNAKLVSVIGLLLDWCATDRVTLVKAYRATLRSLEAGLGTSTVFACREVGNHSAACVDFDVASRPVSIHLPLSRLLAGLHLHLERHGLSFDGHEFNVANKPSPVNLMEMPLRIQVLMAQVQAGMWRRNGYSLINQIYFYHNLRWRFEMYDRDIVMLQIGASLVESNEYLIHLLNKFGLVAWAREGFESNIGKAEEDGLRQTVSLAEEFLGLLITVICERFVPGVGAVSHEDCIRHEIVQQLCIEPMAHSQLVKLLAEDSHHDVVLEEVLVQVASFRKPQGNCKGLFELKAEFVELFNPFFYHYSREEQSKAEEAQRKRKKTMGADECCPPPVPAQLTPAFALLVNLLQCDVMLHVMGIVLNRCNNLRARSFSEMQFLKVLHLMGYALHEQERAVVCADAFFQFLKKADQAGLFSQLEALLSNPRVETHRKLIVWVLHKREQVRQICTDNRGPVPSKPDLCGDDQVSPTVAECPAYLERKRRAELASARRARILAQMSAMQKSFIREHAELFDNVQSNLSGSSMDLSEAQNGSTSVCLGSNHTVRTIVVQKFTCILCQEDQEIHPQHRAMVLSSFVQRSTVLSRQRGKSWNKNEDKLPFAPASLYYGTHTSTCGHVMHADCWQKYFDSVVAKERRRPIHMRNHLSFDIDKQEFLCPLCECLSNTVIPIVASLTSLHTSCLPLQDNSNLGNWIAILEVGAAMQNALDHACEREDEGVLMSQPITAEDLQAQFGDGATCDMLRRLYVDYPAADGQPYLSASMMNMLKQFLRTTSMMDTNPQYAENELQPQPAWQSCAYTIHTIELLLRDQNKPLFGQLTTRQAECIRALVKCISCASWIVPRELVHAACHQGLALLLQLGTECPCVLDVDAFGLLVHMCVSAPYMAHRAMDTNAVGSDMPPVPSSNPESEHLTLQLVFLMHVVQIMVSSDLRHSVEDAMDTDEEVDAVDMTAFDALYATVQHQAKLPFLDSKVKPSVLSAHVRKSSLPFLRCCALFFHYHTGVPPPPDLQECCRSEFESLCKYLSLSAQLDSLLQSQEVKALVSRWVTHKKITQMKDFTSWIQYPLTVNHLVALPSDYSDLINEASSFTCPNSDGEDSRSPTMCLVCGEILCSQSYCCLTELDGQMVGACTNHAYSCGAGVGIFLRVRECKALLLAGKTKGSFVAPPYLDEFGETDQGLKRGNPLHLSQERYKKLHRVWLSHGIPEEIAHALESSSNIIATEWHHI